MMSSWTHCSWNHKTTKQCRPCLKSLNLTAWERSCSETGFRRRPAGQRRSAKNEKSRSRQRCLMMWTKPKSKLLGMFNTLTTSFSRLKNESILSPNCSHRRQFASTQKRRDLTRALPCPWASPSALSRTSRTTLSVQTTRLPIPPPLRILMNPETTRPRKRLSHLKKTPRA